MIHNILICTLYKYLYKKTTLKIYYILGIFMRKCPNCDCGLTEMRLHTEIIDRCEKCNGAFFDRGELEAIIQTVEVFESINLEENEIESIPTTEMQRELCCPADGELMVKQEIVGVIVDICPHCGGIWLDRGEIIALKIAEDHIRENIHLYIRLGS